MLAAVALFAVLGGILKALDGKIGVAQIILFRSVFAFLPLLERVAGRSSLARLRDHRRQRFGGDDATAVMRKAASMTPAAASVAVQWWSSPPAYSFAMPVAGSAYADAAPYL